LSWMTFVTWLRIPRGIGPCRCIHGTWEMTGTSMGAKYFGSKLPLSSLVHAKAVSFMAIVMIFVVFPTFLCLSPKRPHSFTQPMTCFPFPFPHNLYLIFYPTFHLIFLFSHFGYKGQVRSIRFTRRLVSLGLPKESYLLGSHRPFKPHCVHVGDRPLDLLCRGHLRGIQDLGQG